MKRTKSGMARATTNSRFFCFRHFEKQEATLFWKITLYQGATSFIRHTFCTVMMGWVIKIDDKSRKISKIKASGGFWGRFLKPPKIQFYRWHSVFGVKKTILRQWDGKILTAFFRFWKSTKSGFKKNNHFLKEIWSLWKRNKFYFERNCIFVDIVRNIFFKREEEFRCNKKINLFCENQLN